MCHVVVPVTNSELKSKKQITPFVNTLEKSEKTSSRSFELIVLLINVIFIQHFQFLYRMFFHILAHCVT